MREGWVETTLGDVAEWWSGGTPKAREPKYYENGTIPWAVIADMNKGIIDSTNSYITKEALELIGGRLAPAGSVLISMYASVGKSAIANIPLATNQAIAWSIPNQKKIIPFYLYLVSQQLEKEISDLARGETQRNINRQMLRDFTFQLPPLPEQQRIVDLISSVDLYIEALQQQLKSAKRSRNAVLHELLTGGGDGYKEVKLSDVTDLITDGSHFSPKTTDHGIPYVTVRDIKDGFLDLDNAARINEDSYLELEKNGCRPLPNDILFSKDGTVGKVALVVDAERFVVLSSLAIIRSTNSVILPKFLALTMSSSEFQRNAIGSKTGLAIKRIVLKHLRDLRIKVPSIAEQQRVIEIVSEIDLLISCNLKVLAESKKLRTGLLSDLLSGEHEIPASYDKVIGAA